MRKLDWSESIAETKRIGQEYALRTRITNIQQQMKTIWDGTKQGVYCKGLGDTINKAREMLDEMEAVLSALSELEPRNS